MKPTKEFLENLKGDEIRVWYEDYNPQTNEDLIMHFSGQFIGFDDEYIVVQSSSDYKKISLECITDMFSKTKTRKGAEVVAP